MLTAIKPIDQTESKIQKRSGPTVFEIEYLKQLQEELTIFLKGTNCTTLTDIVIGVRGQDYQAVIPMNRGESYAAV